MLVVVGLVGYNYLKGVSDGIFANVANALASNDGAGNRSPDPTAQTTPEPTVVPEIAFAPVALTGSGNSVPRFDIPADAAAIADITHAGGANFAVWTLDANGAEQDLLVNTIGAYEGTVLFDEQTGQHSAAFKVEADGAWTITIKPILSAFAWDGQTALTGSGDDVVLLNPPSSGLSTVTITHSGEANFAVWAYSDSGTDLLVNEIGHYSGESLLADGTFFLEITADGSWTVSPPT